MSSSTVLDEEAVDQCLKDICNALMSSDVQFKLVSQLRMNIKRAIDFEELAAGMNKRRIIQKAVFNELVNLLDSGNDPFKPVKGQPNVIMFVGLQGSGKTTTCTKYAYHYKKKGWRVALVCADTFRAGAFDQLKQNAMKVKVPFYGSYTETDPVKIAQEGVDQFKRENYEIIIVDTSGRHKQSDDLFEEMQQVANVVDPDDAVFIVDSSIGQAAFDQAVAFRNQLSGGIGSIIITKFDGHAKGGGALSAVAATGSPVIFIGNGEHIDDLDPFSAHSFIRRLLGLGDIEGLVSTIQDAGIDQQEELIEKIQQGVFTLRDMYDQFQNLMKLGPLGKVMSMIPGFSQELLPKGREKEGQARIKKFMCMMDSMTDAELDDPRLLQKVDSQSRIYRIARGSGAPVAAVKELLDEFKRFAKMIGRMKNLKMGKNGDMQMNQRNMQQMMRAMDPRMMQQLGGAGGMQNMMKQLANMQGGGGGPFGM